MEDWKKYLEVQSVKFTMHSYSLAHLCKGTSIKNVGTNEEIKYPDLGSIFLLRRAQIENYLMFYYLNIQPQTKDEGELRYYLYELSGFSHRQQYDAINPESIKKKEAEKKEIELLKERIKNNSAFQNLPLQKQNHLLENVPSKLIGWEKLIESSHLKTELFLIQGHYQQYN